MSRTVFLTSNYGRKPEFQLRTVATANGSSYGFKKVAICEEAQAHLSSIQKTYDWLKQNGLDSHFASAKTIQGDVHFEQVKGRGIESLLIDAVLDNDEAATEELLKQYRDFLKKLVVKSKSGHSHDYDTSIFGTGLFEKFHGSECIRLGILDLNFDNVILSGKNLKAIDYEWSFDHCLPLEYIYARSVMWFGMRYAHQLKLHSQRIDIVAYSNDLYLPASFEKIIPLKPDVLKYAYEIEWKFFQPWVNQTVKYVTQPFYEQPKPFSERTLFALDHLELQTGLLSGLNAEVKNLRAELDVARREQEKLRALLNRFPLNAAKKVYKTGGRIKGKLKS